MYFFGKQRSSKASSHLFLLGFVVAMILFMVMAHIAVNAFSMLLGETHSIYASSPQTKAMVAIIWFAVLAGSFFRYLDVRKGGAALARRFGAVPASDSGRFSDEKVLLNVVSEMAIASSCAQPEVFVLSSEHSINAFVVGSTEKDRAIVVSQGALDHLDREELQAVIGHEFGHIAHGDIPINMRLLILLGGLLAIDEIGQLYTGKNWRKDWHFGYLIGLPLRALGSIGVLIANLIRSAFSRQREFLADASAVQYSRNPLAMASALAKVRDENDGEPIHSRHAGELAHLCFHVGSFKNWFSRLFCSHPPIQKRIDEIDPHFATKQRASQRRDEPQAQGVSLAWQQPMTREFGTTRASLPDNVALMVHDTPSCLAVLFAVFASDAPGKRDDYFNAIGFAYTPLFSAQVKHIVSSMSEDLDTHKTAIISYATDRLRKEVQLENRQRLMLNLERLLVVEGEFDLINYAIAQLVRRQLDVEFPVVEQLADKNGELAAQSNVKSFDAMGAEFALLLSLMVESSGAPTSMLEEEFTKALMCYTKVKHPRRTGSEPGIYKDLERAFQTLYVQPQNIRDAFVQHCVEIMHRDGHIARAEDAVIGLFAASLDCDLFAA